MSELTPHPASNKESYGFLGVELNYYEMIEINLLPEELRPKTKKIYAEPDYLIYALLLLLGILICMHICLAASHIISNRHYSILNSKWQKIQPQKKILDNFRKENQMVLTDASIIQQLISQRIKWSEKLNRLSLDLPSGIWFNEIAVSSKKLFLRGSVVSLQKDEMNSINKFIGNLKKDSAFLKDFNNLELSTVQRRVISNYDVVDFVLLGTLK